MVHVVRPNPRMRDEQLASRLDGLFTGAAWALGSLVRPLDSVHIASVTLEFVTKVTL
ncbi:hypothetical protein GCM10010182_70710 [Actinomadura cremea]|nr:hypothetical protein GCM10010182_70710 [Actinomadura cremea]